MTNLAAKMRLTHEIQNNRTQALVDYLGEELMRLGVVAEATVSRTDARDEPVLTVRIADTYLDLLCVGLYKGTHDRAGRVAEFRACMVSAEGHLKGLEDLMVAEAKSDRVDHGPVCHQTT